MRDGTLYGHAQHARHSAGGGSVPAASGATHGLASRHDWYHAARLIIARMLTVPLLLTTACRVLPESEHPATHSAQTVSDTQTIDVPPPPQRQAPATADTLVAL